jgi:hypothetical protein
MDYDDALDGQLRQIGVNSSAADAAAALAHALRRWPGSGAVIAVVTAPA